MSAAEGPRLLTEPLVLNSHASQVEVPAQKSGYVLVHVLILISSTHHYADTITCEL